jgi:hypothetical protein
MRPSSSAESSLGSLTESPQEKKEDRVVPCKGAGMMAEEGMQCPHCNRETVVKYDSSSNGKASTARSSLVNLCVVGGGWPNANTVEIFRVEAERDDTGSFVQGKSH